MSEPGELFLDDLSEGLNNHLKHIALLSQLRQSEGWLLFEKYVKDNMNSLRDEMILRAIHPDEIYKQEFLKGQSYGMIRTLDMLTVLIEVMEQNVEKIRQKLKETPDARSDADLPSAGDAGTDPEFAP